MSTPCRHHAEAQMFATSGAACAPTECLLDILKRTPTPVARPRFLSGEGVEAQWVEEASPPKACQRSHRTPDTPLSTTRLGHYWACACASSLAVFGLVRPGFTAESWWQVSYTSPHKL